MGASLYIYICYIASPWFSGTEFACSAGAVGDTGSILGLGRSPGEEHGNPLKYSCLENLHGQRSIEEPRPWGCEDSDMTQQLSTAQHTVGDMGLIPGLGRSPGGGHGNLLQYSCLENLHGQKSLMGYSPWDHKESDMTD